MISLTSKYNYIYSLEKKKPLFTGAKSGVKMKNIFYFIFLVSLSTSCCFYHSTRIIGNKKISELGIAPYSNRPIHQEMKTQEKKL